MNDFTLSAFVANLGKYNEGELVGEWVRFPVRQEDMETFLDRIGMGDADPFGNVYDELFITDMTTNVPKVGEILSHYENIEKLTKRFEIEEVLPNRLDSCSHGTRQKIMVTGALIHNPPVWILDEPMTGLDPQSAFKLKKMIREHAENGNCVLFSTHVLDTAEEICDKIIIIRKGKVVCFDTVENLKKKYGGLSLEASYLNIVGDGNEKKS